MLKFPVTTIKFNKCKVQRQILKNNRKLEKCQNLSVFLDYYTNILALFFWYSLWPPNF